MIIVHLNLKDVILPEVMRKTIIFTTLLIVLIGFMSWKYFSSVNESSNSNSKAIAMIPADAALVLTLNYNESFKELFNYYGPFEALLGSKNAEDLAIVHHFFGKELISEEDSGEKKVFVSIFANHDESFDMLFSFTCSQSLSGKDFKEILSTKYKIPFTAESDRVYSLKIPNLEHPFFVSLDNDVICGSFSRELALKSSEKNAARLGKEFAEEIKENSQKNRNSPIIVSVDHKNFVKGFRNIFRGRTEGNLALIKELTGNSFLSMNYKSDALMFNGVSALNDKDSSYLELFLRQSPVSSQLKNIIPDNTANYLLFSVSNLKEFRTDLDHFLSGNDVYKNAKQNIERAKKHSGINIDRDVLPYISNEFALVESENREKYAIVKLTNGEKVNFALSLISESAIDNIGRLQFDNIFYYLLGEPFRAYTRPYFTVIDNYLIVATATDVLRQFRNAYSQEKWLAKSKDFQDHSQLVANKSNIEFFVNCKNSSQVFKRSLKGRTSSYFEEPYTLKNFYGVTWQWNADKTHFQLNFFANYLAPQTEVLKELWSFKLSDRLSASFGTYDSGTGSILLVQDRANKMYALTEAGNKKWDLLVDGIVQGNPIRLKDGSLLFNTLSSLHRIDTLGKAIAGYPIKLKSRASGQLVVMGYDPKLAKVFIPATNKILVYALDDADVGHESITVNGNLLNNIQLSSSPKRSYLLAGTTNGTFTFFNPDGTTASETKINPTTNFKGSIFSAFDAANEPQIVACDTKGTLYRIGLHNNIQTTVTNIRNSHSDFEWQNVTGDATPDMIFLDNKQFNVLSDEGVPMYSYTFEESAAADLIIVNGTAGESYAGIINRTDSKLYLFNDEGNLFKGFPVSGTGRFSVCSLRNDGSSYIIFGKNNTIYVYRL